jgi:benzodiazapine receptor
MAGLRRTSLTPFITVAVILGAGMASGYFSGPGYGDPWFDALAKPGFMPPGWAFPVAWTLIYILIGLALARVIAARTDAPKGSATALFLCQFLLNLAWSPAFFAAHATRVGLALIVGMTLLAIVTTVLFRRIDRAAALLMLPYLGWLMFAGALNYAIIRLNP